MGTESTDQTAAGRGLVVERPRSVAVLGGGGFLGRSIAAELADRGHRVRITGRRAAPDWIAALPGASYVRGSVEDAAVVEEALDGVDWAVFSVGCPPPASEATPTRPAWGVGAGQAEALLTYLGRRPAVALSFISSGGAVYGDAPCATVAETAPCRPISQYGRAKLWMEQRLAAHSRRHGTPLAVLRVANAYGSGQSAADGQGLVAALFTAAGSGRPFPMYDQGRAVRDFVHVSDVAKAVAGIPPTPGSPRTVNVGSGRGYRVEQVVAIVESVTGCPIPVRLLPRRPMDVRSVVLDVTRLQTLLPWDPIPLEAGIAAAWVGRDPDRPEMCCA